MYHNQTLILNCEGSDSWNKDDLKENNISITDTEISIGGLMADSTYDFYLFVTNMEGEFDEDVFMKIQKKTNPHSGNSGFLTLASTSVLLTALVLVFLIITALRMNKRKRQYEFSSLAHMDMGETGEEREIKIWKDGNNIKI